MNANQRQQLIDSLGKQIKDYINHYNHLCDEAFFDVSDFEERIAFLNTMYENYKNVDPYLKVMISAYIATAMLRAEENLANNKGKINSRQTILDQFLCDKISTLTAQQQEIVYKNFLYITALLKNDLTLVGQATTSPEVYKSVGDKIRATTLPAIWHKITKALGACNNNSVRFRDALLNVLRAENQEMCEQCDKMRNSFLNAQSNLVAALAEAEIEITGRQMQELVIDNLTTFAQQMHLGGH